MRLFHWGLGGELVPWSAAGAKYSGGVERKLGIDGPCRCGGKLVAQNSTLSLFDLCALVRTLESWGSSCKASSVSALGEEHEFVLQAQLAVPTFLRHVQARLQEVGVVVLHVQNWIATAVFVSLCCYLWLAFEFQRRALASQKIGFLSWWKITWPWKEWSQRVLVVIQRGFLGKKDVLI